MVLVCLLYSTCVNCMLFLDKSPIPEVEEASFLGVISDSRDSFVPHLIYFRKKGLKELNILNLIGNTEYERSCSAFIDI